MKSRTLRHHLYPGEVDIRDGSRSRAVHMELLPVVSPHLWGHIEAFSHSDNYQEIQQDVNCQYYHAVGLIIQMYFLQLLSYYCFNATLCCMGTLILPHRNLKL